MIRNILYKIINIIYWTGIVLCMFVFINIFCFRSFKIPSDSMNPTVITGDHVIVNKMIPGACLFNIFSYIRNERVNIIRIPGINKIQRNDVIVFNFPYPNSEDKIEISLLDYYIKRCVGLPGDTLFIQNGDYKTQGFSFVYRNKKNQERLVYRAGMHIVNNTEKSFPDDSIIGWNADNIGPLYIPRAGDFIQINRTNFVLYKKLIEWEKNNILTYKDSVAYLDNKKIVSYRFEKNYYFMAGDYMDNSRDSRYWGLLPEDFIIGKAWFVWKSNNPYNGKFRWDRFMKIIC